MHRANFCPNLPRVISCDVMQAAGCMFLFHCMLLFFKGVCEFCTVLLSSLKVSSFVTVHRSSMQITGFVQTLNN